MNIKNIQTSSKQTLMSKAVIETDKEFQGFYGLPLIKDLSEHHAMMLFSCMKPQHFKAGETIYKSGEPSVGKMHIILDGKIVVHGASGNKYSSLRKGEVFGLFSFLDDNRTHSATLTVERDVDVLILERVFFDLMALEEPKLANQWLHFMFSLLSKKALELEVEYANIHNFAFGGKA